MVYAQYIEKVLLKILYSVKKKLWYKILLGSEKFEYSNYYRKEKR